jgi:hypothetical protein
MSTTADPSQQSVDLYKAKNFDNAPLKEKVEGLVEFISQCKFGMLTTQEPGSGLLASRCMALASKVNNQIITQSSPRKISRKGRQSDKQ